MKKTLLCAAIFAAASTFGTCAVTARADEGIAPECKAAYLCDYVTGTEVYALNETARLPIASMCKIMTLLLSFEAIGEGSLTYDEEITASERASSMGGSQVFLDTGLSYRAEDLMKSVAVCSANDSCVALSERIAGSEEAFVDKMNARARELGAENTLFANCTGLPKDPQYSCAKDVAIMTRALLKYDKYYEFCKVRVENFCHPDGREIQMTNTNKLIRAYEGCDGGKTGFTNEAGFCLSATAKRGDMRLISVVIGAETSKKRFKGASDLMNYCFERYENKVVLAAGEATEHAVPVRGSRVKEVNAVPEENLCVFRKKGAADDFTVQYDLKKELKAPVTAGAELGSAVLYEGGVECARVKLLAKESAEAFTYWEAYREGARLWN